MVQSQEYGLKANSPYWIGGDISVPANKTLTIQPGTRVEFFPSNRIEVQGSLIAEGTSSDSIYFTIPDIPPNFNLDTFDGGWGGVRIIHMETESDSSLFSFCRFEYGRAESIQNNLDNGGVMAIQSFHKVRIANCLFINNWAGGDRISGGGALLIANSNILLKGNTFRNNKADRGGAIFISDSQVHLYNNSIHSNHAENGGAFFINNSAINLTNSTIRNNSATNNGGAFFIAENVPSTIHFTNMTLTENSAIARGGMLDGGNCNLTFRNCQISNNKSGSYGGAINGYGEPHLVFTNCNLYGNHAIFDGGVVNQSSGELEIKFCTLSENKSDGDGGSIRAITSKLRIQNSLFERDTSGNSGGGIWVSESELLVDSCEFKNNFAKLSYGAIRCGFTQAIIKSSKFSDNRAIWGGALGIKEGDLQLFNSILSGNTSETGGGLLSATSDVVIKHVKFIENRATSGGGLNSDNCNLDIEDCLFSRNQANEYGGALVVTAEINRFTQPLSISISTTDFVDNSALKYNGGVLITQSDADSLLKFVSLDKCIFKRNKSLARTALRIVGKINNVSVSNTIFAENISTDNTAVIGFISGASGEVNNCLFNQNSPRAALVHQGTVLFTNCTFTNTSGAAMDIRRGGTAIITNSIFWKNGRTANVISSEEGGSHLFLNYSDVEFGIDSIVPFDTFSKIHWGTKNFSEDPQFVDTSNFRLAMSSPCLEKGIDSIQIGGKWIVAPLFDLDNNPRPFPTGTKPDLGVFESIPTVGFNELSLLNRPLIYLKQNIPNPFQQSTWISWQQLNTAHVSLEVFNMQGQKINTLINRMFSPGSYQIIFEGWKIPSGLYYYVLSTKSEVRTKSMIKL